MENEIFKNTDREMVIKLANGSFLRLMPVCGNIMRVTCSRETFFYDDSMLVEQEVFSEKIPAVRIDELHTEKSKNIVSVQAGGLKMTIGLQDGALQAEDIKSKEVLLSCCRAEISKTMVMRYTTGGEKPVIERRKTVDGERNFIKNLKEVPDHEAYRAKLYFSFLEGEGIYGFGQAEEGIYNYRKTHQYLYQHNMRIPMPFFYSDHGYGIFFDCCSLMTFQDDCDGSYVYMDAVRQLDFYIIAGKSPDQVIGGLRFLTGKAAMLPKWAFGYIQSKEQYYTAKELADIVRRYRKLAVPLDCVVQDWNTWEPGNWGEKLLDKTRYGDLKERIKEIRQMHAHAMISVWPNMNTGGQNHKEFSDAGYLLHDDSTYDAFDEKARAMYWKQAKEELFNSGFEAWWCDSSEPFSGPDWGGEVKREPWERFTLVGGEHKKYLPWESANIYALMHAKGIYENQRKETEEIRVLNLTRSGYASGQKYAAVLWSGDTCASYETLKKQIIEGLNMGLSGYPYWTLDIGAFFTVGDEWRNRGCGCKQDPTPKWFWKGMYNKGVKDKAYCELYVRWLQMGTFLPMFRSHGTDTPREIWNFGKSGEPFYDAIEKSIRLRYRLMPYIYSMAGMVRHENETIMRSLLFDFSFDEQAKKIDDEFLFGKSILVCPVTEAMYYEPENRPVPESKKTRNCYLPAGAGWYDYFTNRFYQGGKEYPVSAEIDRIPLFVKAGSVIPMKDGLQYADDREDAPMQLHIYPGADAAYTLYEDEGNNYHYEEGAYSLIRFLWHENEKMLQIMPREGTYDGMQTERDFIIEVLGRQIKTLHYTGSELSVLIHDNPAD